MEPGIIDTLLLFIGLLCQHSPDIAACTFKTDDCVQEYIQSHTEFEDPKLIVRKCMEKKK